MPWKLIVILAFMALILPGLGIGKPTAFSAVAFERVQVAMFAAIDSVRADLKANRSVSYNLQHPFISPPLTRSARTSRSAAGVH